MCRWTSAIVQSPFNPRRWTVAIVQSPQAIAPCAHSAHTHTPDKKTILLVVAGRVGARAARPAGGGCAERAVAGQAQPGGWKLSHLERQQCERACMCSVLILG
eukprot:365443-Chlamydomonas_euryale.AAC.2